MMMTADDFRSWLRSAKPGQRTAYFHGFLARTRQDPHITDRALSMLEMAEEAELAHRAGMVSLIQRRIGPGQFEYLAERRRTR